MTGNVSAFICPVCGSELLKQDRSLRCPRGHCYDYAKSGYINLLMSQQGGLHGDDRPMVRARTAFLSAGHYLPLFDLMYRTLRPHLPDTPRILDAGCGEGWYTETLFRKLCVEGVLPEVVGVDISRDALAAASKRKFGAEFAVASLFHVPLPEGWADLILNVFAPDCMDEYSRLISPKGYLLKVIPLEEHLLELKQAVYDSVYENRVSPPEHPDFEPVSDTQLRYDLHLTDGETVRNLFAMTPYGRKTSPEDLAKLERINELTTRVAFSVLLYRKKG